MRSLLAVCVASFLTLSSPASAQQVGALVSADPVVETPPGMQAWRSGTGRATPQERASR